MKHQVFVSYSRKDGALVTPVVRLLRGTEDLVFMDVDAIQPGQKWRAEIDAALSNATLIVVFWCLHSQASTEVRAEYQAAIKAEKNVLPVLLDSTPVPSELEVFQWVDFRELAGERHSQVQGAGKKVYLLYGCLTAIVILFLLLAAVLYSFRRSQAMASPHPSMSEVKSPPTPRPSPTKRTGPRPNPSGRSKPTPIPSPTAVNEPTPFPSVIESPHYPISSDTPPGSDITLLVIFFVIIGALVGGLGWLMWYGRKKEKRPVADVMSVAQEQMSANLEEEIRRRLPTAD
jgi:hypothetical protein